MSNPLTNNSLISYGHTFPDQIRDLLIFLIYDFSEHFQITIELINVSEHNDYTFYIEANMTDCIGSQFNVNTTIVLAINKDNKLTFFFKEENASSDTIGDERPSFYNYIKYIIEYRLSLKVFQQQLNSDEILNCLSSIPNLKVDDLNLDNRIYIYYNGLSTLSLSETIRFHNSDSRSCFKVSNDIFEVRTYFILHAIDNNHQLIIESEIFVNKYPIYVSCFNNEVSIPLTNIPKFAYDRLPFKTISTSIFNLLNAVIPLNKLADSFNPTKYDLLCLI